MKTIVVAGKNDIAVNVLEELIRINNGRWNINIVCNKNETGNNSWQKSLRFFANHYKVKEVTLEEIYDIDDLCFLSLEFDQIVRPDKFKTNNLYNIHFSLLPAYKGMYTSVIPILNGEKNAGVTFHKIERGIDTGDIIYQKSFPIIGLNSKQVYLNFIKEGTNLIISHLEDIISNNYQSKKQSGIGSSYYSKNYIDFSNIEIDLNQTAFSIGQQILAYSFRDYQMPEVYNHKISSFIINNDKVYKKPGTILEQDDDSMTITTIDYTITLLFDKFDKLLEYCSNGDLEEVKNILKKQPFYLDEKNQYGWNPLIVATYNNQMHIVEYLLSLGSDIHVKNNNGTNLLMYAKEAFIKSDNKYLYNLFLSLGISPYDKDYFGYDLYYYIDKIK